MRLPRPLASGHLARLFWILVAALTTTVAAVGALTQGAPATRPGGTRAVLAATAGTSWTTTGPAGPTGPNGSVAKEAATTLPDGGRTVFDGHFLVAYYGTAGNGSLGVLGEASPERIIGRLRRAAQEFARPGQPVQPVFELIVRVADGHPGPDGDYSHDIGRAQVQQYVEAAHRHGVLLVLDLQTGRTDFLTAARHWAWALRDPWVGLALDPEWRMGPGQVPARVIGSVRAAEVNRVSTWLANVTSAHQLPQKLFLIHQFQTRMVTGIQNVVRRPELAMVQHIDGYGTPGEKLATYHRVARPQQFTMGFKLFYDEDKPRMPAARVLAIRPKVSFVSFQ